MQNDNHKALHDVIIVIPSLNPDGKLITLIENIRKDISQIIPIIVIDDGSDKESKSFFNTIQNTYQCQIFTHSINKGKGAALKSAFQTIITDYSTHLGVITVDGDGQHTTEDVKRCIEEFTKNPHSVLLGSRNFENKSIPLRSRIGNIFTRNVINNMNNLNLTDTQTGLRVLPLFTLEGLLEVQGDRYEYEMNMLLYFKDNAIPMKEVPIKTVYIENNESSHFNPLLDSVKIYSVFIRYCTSAVASFLADILTFSLLVFILENHFPSYYIIISTVIARITSGLFNYLSNKHLVFREKRTSSSIHRYVMLFFIQMIASATIVQAIVTFTVYDTAWLIKILIDTIIFFIGFYAQKNWVFKKVSSPAQNITEKL
ncbi:hypothetical protein BKP56_10730 [Marinilactibacillus sp. 15R]|uniref:Glycosyltransferase involved in cell wall bisynthesis n=1 Tax=Marinilactibacillus piezotolerans TaxID=258723 RepID=A0A1I3YGR0_9LACT|nr:MULTISPECIES: bifunctional glycosyltransferase family 2/GtrA family protein [Marinilactibacillus]API89703.1 hypothetical protein BKP56_10730 [Marinilactibacillus sp. 15R]SFK31012.1 Glycosyltransferase involved in cell wall bisynthesis [Marinilactibacillus piezotolerans]